MYKMTKEEYFDLLHTSAFDGTFPSYNKDIGLCAYRADMNPDCKQRCAFGVLIPNGQYCSNMDGIGAIDMLIQNFPHIEKYIPEGLTMHDCLQIQAIHDKLAPSSVVKGRVWDGHKFFEYISELPCFKDLKNKGDSIGS